MARNNYPTIMDPNELAQIETQIAEYNNLLDKLDEKSGSSKVEGFGRNESPRCQLENYLDITWCYHEFAVEGIVLNHLEIKSALDDRIISDSSLIPHYEDVRAYYYGIKRIRQDRTRKRLTVTINTIKELHEIITVAGDTKSHSYRKEIPLHRQYAHDFSPPEKIPYRMRKLGEWLQSAAFRKLPPLMQGASVHNKLMGIFPWPKNSGSLARLVMNQILVHSGYPPIMIPSVERQTYYDNIQSDLIHDSDVRMVNFLSETLVNYLNTVIKKLSTPGI
ncbi:MAG: Fic family protein [Deltaproteobacteria bacterium]|nr:Fic family protein [Deltaproteobacteria bacterium]